VTLVVSVPPFPSAKVWLTPRLSTWLVRANFGPAIPNCPTLVLKSLDSVHSFGVESEFAEVEHQQTVNDETSPLNQTSDYVERVPTSADETTILSVEE